MVDEVEVVSGSNGHGPSTSLGQTSVGLVKGLMDVHKCIDDGLSMRRRLGHFGKHCWENVRTNILQT